MSSIAIRVENLSKRYVISHQRASGDGLRHVLQDKLTAPFRSLKEKLQRKNPSSDPLSTSSLLPSTLERSSSSEDFWALKDVSFEVRQGEVVGIIGRNGAGKSTLLKILSRITDPSSGSIGLKGRVVSLLEVGTGFHPELTGRENIYLNGAILGMGRSEIRRKFEEIIAFAEIEHFIDTPVKRYSSGMYVRLAFAVAAHVDPEIMIVDEVLAVGDLDFQKKCIGSMRNAVKTGRTVLLVSHSLALLESLCSRAILLAHGRIEAQGTAGDIVKHYINSQKFTSSNESFVTRVPSPDARAFLNSIEVVDRSGVPARQFPMGSCFTVRIGIVAVQPLVRPWIGIRLTTPEGLLVAHLANREAGYNLSTVTGSCIAECQFESMSLLPGRYELSIILADVVGTRFDEVNCAESIEVTPSDVFLSGLPLDAGYGMVFFKTNWIIDNELK